MSGHADTIRTVLDWPITRFNAAEHKDALAALDALLAEKQDVRQLLAVTARENKELRAENQRLREALRFYAYNPQYAGDIAREALAGDAE